MVRPFATGRVTSHGFDFTASAAAAGVHHWCQRLHRPRTGPALSQSRRRGLRHRFHGRSGLERRRRRRATTGDVAQSTGRRRSRHSHGRGGLDDRPDAGGLGRQLRRDPATADGVPRAGCCAVRAAFIRCRLRLRFPGERRRDAPAHHQWQLLRRYQDHERARGARGPCQRRDRLHHHPAGRCLRPRIPRVGDRATGNDACGSIPAA